MSARPVKSANTATAAGGARALLLGVHEIESAIPQVIRQTKWTAEEVKDFKALFNILDMNHSGTLEVEDICSVFRARGITRSKEEVSRWEEGRTPSKRSE